MNITEKITQLKLSDIDRSPFSTSISNERAFYLSMKDKSVDFHHLIINEEYLLLDGCGSLYRNGNSVGYFTAGSTLKILDKNDAFAIISIKGNTFKVTKDANFANTPSEFTISNTKEVMAELYQSHYHINLICIKDIKF